MMNWVYDKTSGVFLYGGPYQPSYDPATQSVLSVSRHPDPRLERADAQQGIRPATVQEVADYDAMQATQTAQNRFDGEKLVKALAIWAAQKLNVSLATAKSELLTIYKGLGVLVLGLLSACTTTHTLPNGQVIVPRMVEVRSPFGTNTAMMHLERCRTLPAEHWWTSVRFVKCQPITKWKPMYSQGQGGQIVQGVLIGAGVGIGGALAGSTATATSSSSSSATATGGSVVNGAGRGHGH